MRPFWLLAVAALLIGACGNGGEGDPEDRAAAAAERFDGTWDLVSGRGPDGDVELIRQNPITLELARGRVGGTAACNSYNGRAAIAGSSFRLEGGVSMTEMGCARRVHASESAYLAALQSVDRIAREGRTLTLSGPSARLIFDEDRPVPATDLVGTTWHLDGLVYGSGPDGIVSSAEPARLLLEPDGTLLGSTGCRDVKGAWTQEGDRITVTELKPSGTCSARMQEQDAHVIAVLGDGFTVAIDEQRLTLTAIEGDEGLTYIAP